MEEYKLTIETIKHYKDMACSYCHGDNCVYCEAMYGYNGERWCCFDTVIRFIEWVNKYGYEVQAV